MQEENTEAWIEKEYPDWDVKFYDSWEGCVKALKRDRSTSYRSILPHGRRCTYSGMSTELMNITTSSFQVPLCVAMSEENPEPLISVMNKGDTETRFGGSIGMYIGEYASRRAEGDL